MVDSLECVKMHGPTNSKFVNDKRASDINSYRNVKRKLHKTIAAIWFNKTCRAQPDRPRPTALLTPRSYGKPEAAAAIVDRLLMMGIRMPEKC